MMTTACQANCYRTVRSRVMTIRYCCKSKAKYSRTSSFFMGCLPTKFRAGRDYASGKMMTKQQVMQNIEADLAYYRAHPDLGIYLFGDSITRLEDELHRMQQDEAYLMPVELLKHFGYEDTEEEERVVKF